MADQYEHQHDHCPAVRIQKKQLMKEMKIKGKPADYYLIYLDIHGEIKPTIVSSKLRKPSQITPYLMGEDKLFCPCCISEVYFENKELKDGIHIKLLGTKDVNGKIDNGPLFVEEEEKEKDLNH